MNAELPYTFPIEFNGVEAMAITFEVTARGQISLPKEVLNHLGVRPGDKLDIDLLMGGRMKLKPKRGNSPTSVFGMLARPGTPQLTIEKINQIAASGWAYEG